MKSAFIFLLFSTLLALQGAEASWKETVVKEFDVEPNTRYKLSFDADTTDKGLRWELRILNRQNELLHSGYFKKPWQFISPDRNQYQHSFLTPRDGAKLKFIIAYQVSAPNISNIQLKKIETPDLVINGDFSGGKFDYSGWNERYKAKLTERDGRTVLEGDVYGYALSDPVPVVPGEVYTYPKGKDYQRYGEILVYDQDMLRIGQLPPYHHKKNKTFKMPDNAAYVRFLFRVVHTHLYDKMTVKKLGFVPVNPESRSVKTTECPKASGEIILAVDCDMQEHRAARELQHWIREITGKRMPVLAEPSPKANTKIFIGSRWASQFPEDLKYLSGTDGFAVRRKGDNIYIFGSKPTGTLFGVARFLELNTDIIWARPHKDFGTVFSKQPEIKFKNTDFRSRPVFTMRCMSFSGGLPMTDTQFWMGRTGINTPVNFSKGFDYQQLETGAMKIVGGGIFTPLHKRYKFEYLKKNHPEFFPFIDGKRMIKKHWINPCFTDKGALKAMIEGFRELLNNAPEQKVDMFLCFQSDTWRVCACENCMKPIELPNGKTLAPKSPYSEKDPRFFSTRMFMLFNKIAEALVNDYPDLKIMTHAYIYSAEPPAVTLHPAIKPQFAAYPNRTIRYPLLDGKNNGTWGDMWEKRFRKWLELHKNKGLSFFGYYNPDGFSAVADAAAADMKELEKAGGYGVHNESNPDVEYPNKYTGGGNPYSYKWDADAMERWVIARLMWDPKQDPEELRKYYIKRTFREAAPTMSKFFELIRKSWHDPNNKTLVNCHSTKRDLFEEFIIKPGLEKRARALLVTAEKTAVHPNSKKMVQRILARFDNLRDTLGRHSVPNVDESTHDWNDPVSPHWEKAIKFDNFKLVDDWRVFNREKAKQQTEVRVMCDDKNVYFRITAFDDAPESIVTLPKSKGETFPNGDRIEIVLRTDGRNKYYFAIGPNGNFYSNPKIKGACQVKTVKEEKAWIVMIAIPLADLKLNAEKPELEAKIGRIYRLKGEARKESTLCGASIYNTHRSLWTSLIIERKGE